jgi:peptidoglycan biosynthesis protein MviN/MurJ (putative lipid II flippase)
VLNLTPEPDLCVRWDSAVASKTSIAALTNGALLLVLLRRHLAGIGGSHLSMTVAKSAVAATVMAAVAFPIERWLFADGGPRIGAVRLLAIRAA